MNALSTQFNGFSVAPTHSEICVLGLNGPRLKVKAVHEVILSNSHCEGCTWMGGQINLREHPPKKQALIPTRNPLQSCGCMWACSSAGRAPALQESRQNHTSAASGVAYAGTRGAINLLNWTEVGPKLDRTPASGLWGQRHRTRYVASHRRNVQPTLEPAALRSAIKRTQL